jgi:hypothetical protein
MTRLVGSASVERNVKTLTEVLSEHGLVAKQPRERLELDARARASADYHATKGNPESCSSIDQPCPCGQDWHVFRRPDLPRGTLDIMDEATGFVMLTAQPGRVWRWLRNTGRIK